MSAHEDWHNILENMRSIFLNPLSANITKWSNTLKQFVGKLPTNCLSVLAILLTSIKGLKGFKTFVKG